MRPNGENCTRREAFVLPFPFKFTCRIGRTFNVGLAECKLNSSPTTCGFIFVLHFSGVPPGITEKILRNIVIFCNTSRGSHILEKRVIGKNLWQCLNLKLLLVCCKQQLAIHTQINSFVVKPSFSAYRNKNSAVTEEIAPFHSVTMKSLFVLAFLLCISVDKFY